MHTIRDFIRQRHCRNRETRMNRALPHRLLFRHITRVDERLQQTDGRNADNRQRQAHFKNRSIHVARHSGRSGCLPIRRREAKVSQSRQNHRRQLGNHRRINQVRHCRHNGVRIQNTRFGCQVPQGFQKCIGINRPNRNQPRINRHVQRAACKHHFCRPPRLRPLFPNPFSDIAPLGQTKARDFNLPLRNLQFFTPENACRHTDVIY